jgi:hypothetical protein
VAGILVFDKMKKGKTQWFSSAVKQHSYTIRRTPQSIICLPWMKVPMGNLGIYPLQNQPLLEKNLCDSSKIQRLQIKFGFYHPACPVYWIVQSDNE